MSVLTSPSRDGRCSRDWPDISDVSRGSRALRGDHAVGARIVMETADTNEFADMTRRRKFHRRVYLGILHRQKLRCACGCGEKLTRKEGYQFDHWTALALGGADGPLNLRALRTPCHKKKSIQDIRRIRKADRQRKAWQGVKKRRDRGRAIQSRGFDKTRRRKFDGTVEVRT